MIQIRESSRSACFHLTAVTHPTPTQFFIPEIDMTNSLEDQEKFRKLLLLLWKRGDPCFAFVLARNSHVSDEQDIVRVMLILNPYMYPHDPNTTAAFTFAQGEPWNLPIISHYYVQQNSPPLVIKRPGKPTVSLSYTPLK